MIEGWVVEQEGLRASIAFLRRAALPPLVGVAIGLGAVSVAARGHASRPAIAAGIVALGAIAGLLPLRLGLPAAIVLASLEGFFADFLGSVAPYWNEAYLGTLCLRSLGTRRPGLWECLAWSAAACFYAAWLASGTDPEAVLWAAKVLLASVLGLWAVARLRPGPNEWNALYSGLLAAVAAGFALAVWQKSGLLDGLASLGTTRRLVHAGGPVPLGGFTSAASFSYFLAIATLCWAAMLASEAGRRTALATAWLPVLAAIGIAWSGDRVSIVAAAAAALVAGGFSVGQRASVRVVTACIVLAALIATPIVVDRSPRKVVQAFTFGSDSARARVYLWRAYGARLTRLGAGPASAGAAYAHVAPPGWKPPLEFTVGWTPFAYEDGRPVRRMGDGAALLLQTYSKARPPLTLVARATTEEPGAHLLGYYRELSRPERAPRLLVDQTVGEAPAGLHIAVPHGRGAAVLDLRLEHRRRLRPPPAAQKGILLGAIRLSGLPPPRSPAEQVYVDALPNVLDVTSPGVVDNLYLSWLFQYGLLAGALVCAGWIALMLSPWLGRGDSPARVAARAIGIFMAVAALGVNVWEEFPTDLVAALVLGVAFGAVGQSRGSTVARRSHLAG